MSYHSAEEAQCILIPVDRIQKLHELYNSNIDPFKVIIYSSKQTICFYNHPQYPYFRNTLQGMKS